MNVEAKIWAITQGKITKLKYDGKIFVNNGYQREGSGRIPVLEKWIIDEDIEAFTSEDFFKVHPQQRGHPAQYEMVVGNLIKDKKIEQLGNDKFRVLI